MIQCSGSQWPDIAAKSSHQATCIHFHSLRSLGTLSLYLFAWYVSVSVCECEYVCVCSILLPLSSVLRLKHCFFMRWSRFPIALLLVHQRVSLPALAHSWLLSVFTTLFISLAWSLTTQIPEWDDLSHWKWQSLKKKKTISTQNSSSRGSCVGERQVAHFSRVPWWDNYNLKPTSYPLMTSLWGPTKSGFH